jgi:hypothetical protein
MLDKIVEDVIRGKANAMRASAEYKKDVKEFAQEIKDRRRPEAGGNSSNHILLLAIL